MQAELTRSTLPFLCCNIYKIVLLHAMGNKCLVNPRG